MDKSESKKWLRFNKWIAIIPVLVGIVGLIFHIQSSNHNTEIRSLEAQHKIEIENLKAAYRAETTELAKEHERKVQELTDKTEDLTKRVGELEKSFSSLDSVLVKLSQLIGDRAKDRLSKMRDILDRNKKAHVAVIELLKEFSGKYRKSEMKKELIETHFSNYYQSVNETMVAYEDWHEEISDLLIDFRAWLRHRKKAISPYLDIAERKFERTDDLLAWRISDEVLEEWQAKARKEDTKINSALQELESLETKLNDNKRKITENTP